MDLQLTEAEMQRMDRLSGQPYGRGSPAMTIEM